MGRDRPRDANRDREIDRLLTEALERPASERRAFIEHATTADGDLRRQVLRMLQQAELGDGELATGALLRDGLGEDLLETEFGDDASGRQIGPYRLLHPLGRGGSATVYLGERTDGAFEHRVAIKVLHAAEGALAGVARRFEQERQILAGLTHPGIAVLLDGGTTEWGRPFLVVEHVDGEPIDRYCRTRDLSLHERLRLFLDVAAAVEFAHRHLIVHRDLKPSNIMVTNDGQVKLLDFGIAKLLDPAQPAAVETRTGTACMTPRYASPEQILGNAITTASDVYQLGLLLYELLTGEPAFELSTAAPSVLVDTARERTSLQPRKVAQVPTDLDAIVSMATRPEPERRHASVGLLADDVQAFLERRPVRARGDSLAYSARRFVSRHRLAVALSGAMLIAVGAFSAAVTWGFLKAERQRIRAESIEAFLKETLRGAQPYVALGRDGTLLKEILQDAAKRIDAELADQPHAAAEVHSVIADTFRSLSDYEEAEVHATAAARGFDAELGPNAPETLRARKLIGLLCWEQGRNEEAEAVLQDVYSRAAKKLGVTDPLTITTMSSLGLTLRAQGRLEEAEPLYRGSMERAIDGLGLASENTIAMIGNLAFLLTEMDRLEEAEPLARQAADLSREHLGPDNPDTFLAVDKLAFLVGQRGRPEEALQLHQEALDGMRRVLGERHSTTLGSTYSMAISLRRLGRHEESIATLEGILPILHEEFGEESPYVVSTLRELGRALLADGRAAEALPHLERALAVASREHYLHALLNIQRAEALIETGRPERARDPLTDARRLLEATFGSDGTHRHFQELVRVEAKLRRSPDPG